MNRNVVISLTVIVILLSCNESKQVFIPIDFQLEENDWDKDAYKLTNAIVDSIINSEGFESAATEFSIIGEIAKSYKLWDIEYNQTYSPSETDKQQLDKLRRQDAIPYILRKATKHEIVIINEAHHVPQHRIFTTQLLDGLKEQGFTHLGLETTFNIPQRDSIINSNKYPELKSGIYSKEPQFGNLIRLAIQKGFQIFSYETMGNFGKQREIDQAQNIKNYMDNHPNGKFLIHCGYSHGYEGNLSNSWEKAMASRLKDVSQKDPLTIDQTIYTEKGENEYENPLYQLVDVEVASVYLDKDGDSFGKYKHGGYFDIAVFHPRRKDSVRPKWMLYDDREYVEISFEQESITCPCLVLAYVKGEPIGSAIPYDIVQADNKTATLVLSKEEYDIVIWNKKDTSIRTTINNK